MKPMPHIFQWNANNRDCTTAYGFGGNVMHQYFLTNPGSNTNGLMPAGCGFVRCRFDVEANLTNTTRDVDLGGDEEM